MEAGLSELMEGIWKMKRRKNQEAQIDLQLFAVICVMQPCYVPKVCLNKTPSSSETLKSSHLRQRSEEPEFPERDQSQHWQERETAWGLGDSYLDSARAA
ncbi:hypothetical protein COCON_G00011410 [Conger conger]|uniref:Uncharacterized protein n=1 Tax=Conger conger TaxID=82655 RepID=A0A9Q1E2L8_CONCO|nr:hypothetical protein COCON_G00011410 [Conger conger]